ncbi:DUF5675 family protein [Sphingobacterium cellulitidis]|uniref:DUF5675 family protein n=1 Tax=Sphingobacterium cellulitidis TaxID=1768011 RepID=UPI0015C60CD4|nr:DUF5675 family protein [Sphingobacterium cellulitidis]
MLELVRVHKGQHSTLSHLYIDSLFACYILEDSIRARKIFGRTCIPEGRYSLSLNMVSGLNKRYAPKFGKKHQGMIEIMDVPNFTNIFFHIGNYHTDTMGCPLMGSYYKKEDQDYIVLQSGQAYKTWYPVLLKKLQQGDVKIKIINRLRDY